MDTLEKILDKYNLEKRHYIDIPNVDRDDIAKMFHDLDFKIGVEVGVQGGLYSEVICRENPQMTVYGVDPWAEYVLLPASGDTPERLFSQSEGDEYYRQTKERLASYPKYKMIRATSLEAVKQFKDGSIDCVYIDASHEFQAVWDDITAWLPKIRVGGIMSGHDFRTPRHKPSKKFATIQVKAVVMKYVATHKISPLIIWGADAKIPGILRESTRSWSFIKM